MTGGLTSSGGPGGIGANTDDMRATANALARTNDDIGQVALHAGGAAASGALLRTTIFSPVSAAKAEAHLLDAAASVASVAVRVEGSVLVLRTRAELFDLADAGKSAIHTLESMASVPLGIAIAVWAGFDRAGAARFLSAHPELTELVTGGLVDWIVLVGGGRSDMPRDYDDVLHVLQDIAQRFGKWQGGPISVDVKGAEKQVAMNNLHDLVGSGAELEGVTGKDPSASGMRIVRIEHPPGRPSWVVVIPGTDFGGDASDPSNAGANLSLMQGHDELMKAVRNAMAQSHIASGDQVMVTGHSQGGIAAMALACDPQGYNITNVVTTGAPVSRFHPPASVHVLSIEHAQDPVPRLDGQPNPDQANWTTITRDVSDVPGTDHQPSVHDDPLSAHAGGLYTQTADEIDHSGLASLPAQFTPSGGGHAVQQDYHLQRK